MLFEKFVLFCFVLCVRACVCWDVTYLMGLHIAVLSYWKSELVETQFVIQCIFLISYLHLTATI